MLCAAAAADRPTPRDEEGRRMRIAMASDHAGFALKQELAAWLTGEGHEVSDFGAESEDAVDLPDTVYPAALAVGRGEAERGVFVDGVGYGSAMIANRILGVDAAVCQDPFCAALARSHSDTNVLCLGGKIIGSALALEIVRVWLTTEPLAEDKYQRRVRKGREIASRHLRPLD
jgi:ribose 5-phosphate isomerase B